MMMCVNSTIIDIAAHDLYQEANMKNKKQLVGSIVNYTGNNPDTLKII